MIKVIEDLSLRKTKNIETDIEKIIKRLKTLKENIAFNPDKYDLEILVDILTQIYDDIGDFNIMVDTETLNGI